jgi:hypothetical protein
MLPSVSPGMRTGPMPGWGDAMRTLTMGERFGPQMLFAANEPGFHAETYDPQSLLTRRNQLTYSEFPSGTSNLSTVGTLVTASALTGYDGAIAVGWDGVTGQQAYKSVSTSWAVGRGVLSVIVKMDDGGVPAFDNLNNSNHDFTLVAGSTNVTPLGSYTVEALGGGFYRVWALATPGGGSNYGVQKTATNSSRTFVTTGWSFEPNVSTPGAYQKVTDWYTEYMAAALNSIGMWQDSAGTTPVTAVEQVVGCWVDSKRGLGVAGAATLLDGKIDTAAWTKNTGWTATGPRSASCDGSQAGSTDLNGGVGAPAVADQHVRYRFTITAISGSLSVFPSSGSSNSFTTPGTYVCTGPGGSSNIFRMAAAGQTCTITNIYVEYMHGWRAIQATSASRPTLSARYNLLTKTEQFDDAAWTKFEATVSANTTATTDPLGGNTADKLIPTAVLASHGAEVTIASSSTVFSVYAKKAEASLLMLFAVGENKGYGFDLDAGTTFAPGGITASSTFTMTDVGNGWYRCTITAATTTKVQVYVLNSTTYGSYSGNGVNGLYVWGADLRTTNDAALNQPAYQRVNTSTDYDTSGFIHYLKFDGTDDGLQTPSIAFTGDKMTAWVGATKLSDASGAILFESGSSYSAVDGTFGAAAPAAASATFSFSSRAAANTITRTTSTPAYTSPISGVVVAQYDLAVATAAGQVSARVNGVSPTSFTDVGVAAAGTWTAQPLNIGRRNGATAPFNGRLTSLTARGTTTATSEAFIRRMEQYAAELAGKTFTSA